MGLIIAVFFWLFNNLVALAIACRRGIIRAKELNDGGWRAGEMKRFLLLTLISVFLISTVIGCRSEPELEIRPAPIHEVNISFAKSFPAQVSVYIKGGLSDGCTTFHDLVTKRNGKTIEITVTTQRPREAACPQIYGFFEKNANLGSDFIKGETYSVKVNDKVTGFTMP